MDKIDATIELLRTNYESSWAKKFMAGWTPDGIDALDASVIRELINEERSQRHVARSRAKRPISKKLQAAIEENDMEALAMIKPKNKKEEEVQLTALKAYIYEDV